MKEMFKRSAETMAVHNELVMTAVGAVVTYARLSEVAGISVVGETSCLASARRIAQREDRMVFAAVKGVGMKRLDSEGIVGFAGEKTHRVRRGAWRAGKLLPLANFAELRDSSRQRAIALASVLAVAYDLVRERSLLTVAKSAVAGTASSLPIRATLQALGLVSRSGGGAP
jgi:hypothetical protein